MLSGTLHTADGAPIAGASLMLSAQGGKFTAVTGSDGTFFLRQLPQGNYDLAVLVNSRKVAYPEPISLPINHVAAGQPATTLAITLDPAAGNESACGCVYSPLTSPASPAQESAG